MTINIAFSATDSYIDYMGTTIFSLIQHHPDDDLAIFVLSSWLSEHSRFKLAQLENERVTITVLSIDREQFSHLPIKNNISLETYFRFLLPDLLLDCERVLYLDCDILVQGNLRSFFETDLTGYYAAGVNERDMLCRNVDYRRSIGFGDEEYYVNAGVLLLNLEAMRQNHMVKTFFEKGQELKDVISYQDQDILNITLKGQIKNMPAIYNYTSYERELNEIPLDDVVIIHYSWHKPWVHTQHVLQYNYPAFARYQVAYQAYRRKVEPVVTLLVSLVGAGVEASRTCMDSILKQTYANLEIVVLAPFGEIAQLAEEYALRDVRCRLELVSSQQEVANYRAFLGKTTGEIIGFIDGREWLDEGYVASLYRQLKGQQADIALSSFTLFNDETGVYNFFEVDIASGQVRTGQRVVETCVGLKWFEQQRHLSLTGKLYRRSVLEKAELLSPVQDQTCWSLLLFLAANRVAYGEQRQYVKRLSKIEEQQELTVQELIQIKEDWHCLLRYISRKAYQTTHINGYYMGQLDRLFQRAWELGELTLCDTLEAEVNACRTLDQW